MEYNCVMEKNYIPYFIYDKFIRNEQYGEFHSITMFVDIVGFTSMTQNLIKFGNEGFEVLSEMIHQVFEPIIDLVYIHNGWVATFAGDALTAIFPESNVLHSLNAAKKIRNNSNGIRIKTKFGNFNLKIRIGLSSGIIEWGIIKHIDRNSYYFKGKAINNCAISEKHCSPGEIIIDSHFRKKVKSNVKLSKIGNNYFTVNNVKNINPVQKSYQTLKTNNSVISKFINTEILDLKEIGEFRNIVSIFISFLKHVDESIHYTNFPAKNPEEKDHCKLYPPQGPSRFIISPQK